VLLVLQFYNFSNLSFLHNFPENQAAALRDLVTVIPKGATVSFAPLEEVQASFRDIASAVPVTRSKKAKGSSLLETGMESEAGMETEVDEDDDDDEEIDMNLVS
jgi:hypothetical protein